mmetsp:Transcript_12329/g.31281  ORF Transcript_12329/g.31281 Transcript_12329/m.31281 type:complete len:475 (-) Transcript_12329:313-1737(-)
MSLRQKDELDAFLSSIPDFQIDDRIGVLFSRLPASRDVKPHEYDAKLSFWTPTLQKYTERLQQFRVTVSSLQRDFTVRGLVPTVFPGLLHALCDRGAALRVSELQRLALANKVPSIGGWLWSNLVSKPVSYSWKSLLGFGSSAGTLSDDAEEFVLLAPLRKVTDQLYRELCLQCVHATDSVISLSVVERALEKQHSISTKDLFLPVFQLAIDGKAKLIEFENGDRGIKICRPGEGSITEVTEDDRSLLRLKHALDRQQKQLDFIGARIKTLMLKIHDLLKENRRSHARRLLQQKKTLDGFVEKREMALHNLQQVLDAIDHAHTQAEILTAYEAGAQSLRSATAAVSLDQVDKVWDELEEVMDDQHSLDDALTATLQVDAVDDSILEHELEALIRDQVAATTLPPAVAVSPTASPISTAAAAAAPAAASTASSKKESEEDRAMADLEKSFASLMSLPTPPSHEVTSPTPVPLSDY